MISFIRRTTIFVLALMDGSFGSFWYSLCAGKKENDHVFENSGEREDAPRSLSSESLADFMPRRRRIGGEDLHYILPRGISWEGGLKNPIFIDERCEDIDKVFNGWIIIVF